MLPVTKVPVEFPKDKKDTRNLKGRYGRLWDSIRAFRAKAKELCVSDGEMAYEINLPVYTLLTELDGFLSRLRERQGFFQERSSSGPEFYTYRYDAKSAEIELARVERERDGRLHAVAKRLGVKTEVV